MSDPPLFRVCEEVLRVVLLILIMVCPQWCNRMQQVLGRHLL